MTIQGILFDKDGTLLDYHATWMPLNRRAALAAAGGDVVLAERLLVASGYDPVSDTCVADSVLVAGSNDDLGICWAEVVGGDAAELTDRLSRIFEAGSAETAVAVEGLGETLEALAAGGLTLGVATNDSEEGALNSLAPFGVLDRFDFIAGYDSGHGAKPGPGMVQGFCKAMGIAPAAVAVVGDSRHDMEMGRRAGAGLLVGVLTGSGGHDDLAPHSHHVLDSIAGLEALLGDVAGKRRA
ncbi:HAD family hydrolase [Pelagibius litoralis]|uniref:phosphoglycolate phosphatase n=1 Tax=Pelagibius litoralis TaxID=374515 RepID=A0A967C271_9PROT|nr:HAD family hydrolase [Pelagibius litoralis]NIA68911.1 HAD family hydrolase [Pelagibius litoralis]